MQDIHQPETTPTTVLLTEYFTQRDGMFDASFPSFALKCKEGLSFAYRRELEKIASDHELQAMNGCPRSMNAHIRT